MQRQRNTCRKVHFVAATINKLKLHFFVPFVYFVVKFSHKNLEFTAFSKLNIPTPIKKSNSTGRENLPTEFDFLHAFIGAAIGRPKFAVSIV